MVVAERQDCGHQLSIQRWLRIVRGSVVSDGRRCVILSGPVSLNVVKDISID